MNRNLPGHHHPGFHSVDRPNTLLSRAGLRLIVLAALALTSWLPSASRAHMQGMFTTKAAAQKRAQELKCEGAFQMGSLWMPCANERALHKALQNN